MHLTRTATTVATLRNSRLLAPLAAMALGLTILFAAGFVQGENGAMHNAAHDTRHTAAFPCH